VLEVGQNCYGKGLDKPRLAVVYIYIRRQLSMS